MVRQLQNLVGHIPQPKAVRGADALAGVRDLTPPQRAGVSPPYRIRDYSRAKRDRFRAIAALTR